MIAETSNGRAFGPLMAYLLRGPDGTQPERVAWSAVRNLSTDDPDVAAHVMQATAGTNVRVEEPVYHLTLSFHPHDQVTPDQVRAIADRVLRDLGLDGHQAVMVAHNDRPNAHVHLAINRIHPETHHAWDRWQDWAQIERSRRAVEEEYGLTITDGPLDRGRAVSAGKPDPARVVDAGRIDAAVAAVRAAEKVRQLDADLDTAVSALKAAEARGARVERAGLRAIDASSTFDTAFDRLYINPDAARAAFRRSGEQLGADAALRALAERPETFSPLVVDIRRRGLGLLEVHDDSAARTQASHAAGLGREAFAADRDLRALNQAYDRTGLPPSHDAKQGQRSIEDVARAAREAATAEVATAARSVDGLRGQRGPSRDAANIGRTLAATINRLAPPELRRLHTLLTNPQIALVRSVSRAIRTVALGHDAER